MQSEPELVTIQTTSDIQTLPIEEQRPTESTSQDATTDTAVLQKPPIEPYSGKVTLNLEEWRTVATNLREFLHQMQMNIRDIHSDNYEEMRECEVDTKVILCNGHLVLETRAHILFKLTSRISRSANKV